MMTDMATQVVPAWMTKLIEQIYRSLGFAYGTLGIDDAAHMIGRVYVNAFRRPLTYLNINLDAPAAPSGFEDDQYNFDRYQIGWRQIDRIPGYGSRRTPTGELWSRYVRTWTNTRSLGGPSG